MVSINLSQCCHTFLSCVPEVAVLSYAVGFQYISRDIWVLSPLLQCSLMMCANNRVHYRLMVVLVCLRITLPVECVSKIKPIISLSCNIRGCVCSAFPFILWWLWKYVYLYLIIITKSQVWPICYNLVSGHEKVVCAVCLSIFLCHIIFKYTPTHLFFTSFSLLMCMLWHIIPHVM